MTMKIEIEMSDELQARLEKVAKRVALTPAETAKMLLAERLAGGLISIIKVSY